MTLFGYGCACNVYDLIVGDMLDKFIDPLGLKGKHGHGPFGGLGMYIRKRSIFLWAVPSSYF